MQFKLLATQGKARRGQLVFPRGVVETPAFMPVGTYGTVKGMTPEELKDTGAHICLGNTFHLMLRPGTGIIQQHGDLHDFMHWDKPILTDSGGFQVFSLGAMRKINEKGVTFRSPINGEKILLTPEKSIEVQRELGSDIVMIFDECTPYPATEQEARISMELSLRWAQRSKDEHGDSPAALFGIIQGGMYEGLRDISLEALEKIGFDGFLVNDQVSKVSVVGIGMRSHAGVAHTMFSALAEKNINIEVIATSEIKISVLIDSDMTELAVRALHGAFELDRL